MDGVSEMGTLGQRSRIDPTAAAQSASFKVSCPALSKASIWQEWVLDLTEDKVSSPIVAELVGTVICRRSPFRVTCKKVNFTSIEQQRVNGKQQGMLSSS